MPRDYRHAVAEPESTEGQRECHRGVFCTGYRLVPGDNGTSVRAPGLTHQAFCPADTTLIASRLDAQRGLPGAYWWLAAEIGNPARRGEMVRVPFGPRILLSEYYDLLMRRITEVLSSWEQRVRPVARWSAPDSNLEPFQKVTEAARRLSLPGSLSMLLALQPGKMTRTVPTGELRSREAWRESSPLLALWQDARIIRAKDGMAVIEAILSGADAGTELLDLFARCLAALGQVGPRAEILDGIPCRSCGTGRLVRAEPPSDPTIEADYSVCPNLACRDRMKLATYRQWCARYEAWARSLEPLTCRRCELGMHDQCVYTGCDCATLGHPAST